MKKTITYCFSLCHRKHYSDENFKLTIDIMKQAFATASKFYNIEILTDNYSVSRLAKLGYTARPVTDVHFHYLDDFKVELHKNHSSEFDILVDPDIVFYDEVTFPDDKDLIVDRMYDALSETHSIPMIEEFIENGVQDVWPEFDWVSNMPNIGFFKFNNNDLKLEYIEIYSILKKWLLDSNITFSIDHSILLGQYPLQILCNKHNITPHALQDLQGSKYYHYDGARKWKDYRFKTPKLL